VSCRSDGSIELISGTRLVRALDPTLTSTWGLGFVRQAPAETQIESDRRAICGDEQLCAFAPSADKVVKTRALPTVPRGPRCRSRLSALVGYTNAGKSTAFQSALTAPRWMAKDMLFATLDPTMRKPLVLPGWAQRFPQRLPWALSLNLRRAFAALRALTLEEVLAADIICHVRDISHAEKREPGPERAGIF